MALSDQPLPRRSPPQGESYCVVDGFTEPSSPSCFTRRARRTLELPPLLLVLEHDTIDRIGAGNQAALEPDGTNDGVFTVRFSPETGEHTIVGMKLDGTNAAHWDTDPATEFLDFGAAPSLLGDLFNHPDGSVRFTISDGGSFVVFASQTRVLVDALDNYQLTLTFADGTTAQANVKKRSQSRRGAGRPGEPTRRSIRHGQRRFTPA